MTNAVVCSRFGLSLAWAIVVGVVEICVFAQMAGRVAAVSGRATFEHGLVTKGWRALLGGPAGIDYHPPSRPNRPGRPKGRPPGSLAGPGTWDYQVIIVGAVAS